jgi:DNA-binding CsgD family transcriptional regulator
VFDALHALAMVRARRGDPGYRELLDRAKELAEEVGDLQFVAPVAAARAEAAWLEGRPDAVAPETAAAFALALDCDDPGFLGMLGIWRWRAGIDITLPDHVDDVYRLQLSGDEKAAAELWFDRGCGYDGALALASSEDPALLRRALDRLQQLGARPAAAIVSRRLRQLGERRVRTGPRRRTSANPAGLTQRQLEVLALLSEGLRNAEIAERLIVAERTVDHHVSAILGKLDARTRGEAVARAAELGLSRSAGPAASSAG